MRIYFVVLLLVFGTGCAGIDKAMTGSGAIPTNEERAVLARDFRDLNEQQRESFIEGVPWVGMTQKHLAAMWNNQPAKTQRKITQRGHEEIQIYHLRVGNWKTGIRSQYWKVVLI